MGGTRSSMYLAMSMKVSSICREAFGGLTASGRVRVKELMGEVSRLCDRPVAGELGAEREEVGERIRVVVPAPPHPLSGDDGPAELPLFSAVNILLGGLRKDPSTSIPSALLLATGAAGISLQSPASRLMLNADLTMTNGEAAGGGRIAGTSFVSACLSDIPY